MHTFIQKELAPFKSNGQLSPYFVQTLVGMLLDKAEGVFLWIFLATKSLITGIRNQDDEKTLFQRLEELPAELEGLYAEMWRRLNAETPYTSRRQGDTSDMSRSKGRRYPYGG